jgi:hypothetical protein
MEGETGKDVGDDMNTFKVKIEMVIETSQFESHIVGGTQLAMFLRDVMKDLDGTEYVTTVKTLEVSPE